MARTKLTLNRIRSTTLPSGKKQAFLRDSDVPGLGVRITNTAKVFIVQGRIAGSSSDNIRIKIGATESITLEDARNQSRQILSLMAQGIDPREELKRIAAQEEEQRQNSLRENSTFGTAWQDYLQDNESRWGAHHLKEHVKVVHQGGEKKIRGKGKTIKGILANLVPLKLSDLTPELIETWSKTESKTRPAYVANTFRKFRAFCNWCNEQNKYKNIIPPETYCSKRHGKHLPKETLKKSCLQREQLKPWFKAAISQQNRIVSAYLQVALITGARREEVASIKWEDIDFKWQSILIRDKVEGQRIIPLTPYVAALLHSLPKRNQYAFSSTTSKSGYIVEPRRVHTAICQAAAIPQLTVQDLRRSFSTLSEWVEMPTGIAAQIQGHKPSATVEKHYKARSLDILLRWNIKLEAWILKQAGIKQPKKTVAYKPQLKIVNSLNF